MSISDSFEMIGLLSILGSNGTPTGGQRLHNDVRVQTTEQYLYISG